MDSIIQESYFGTSLIDAIPYTTAAQHLAQSMDRVCNENEAIIVIRDAQKSVVIISLNDYQSLEAAAKHKKCGPFTRIDRRIRI